MVLERKELIQIREKTKHAAQTPHLNPSWKRAYLHIADAVNHLDAMIARTRIRKENVKDA